jgi:hypothetical protein
LQHLTGPDHDNEQDNVIMATATITALPGAKATTKAKTTKAPKASRKPSLRERLAVMSAGAIGGVAVGATALSLSDLADTVQDVAHCATWKAWAMAAALDANFIATESFSLFATAAVAKATHRATTATKVITLAMSAAANSYSMAHTADNVVMAAAGVAFGVAIPALL